ncbi:unnamed protein product, partial [Prorocentrum cordatum]
ALCPVRRRAPSELLEQAVRRAAPAPCGRRGGACAERAPAQASGRAPSATLGDSRGPRWGGDEQQQQQQQQQELDRKEREAQEGEGGGGGQSTLSTTAREMPPLQASMPQGRHLVWKSGAPNRAASRARGLENVAE